jgi:hypothetical protein
MFQFRVFSLSRGLQVFNLQGCPIRTSTDQRSFAPPRSFSQLTTSFVVSESQGIPHTPLFASYSSIASIISHASTHGFYSHLFSTLLLYSPVLSMNFYNDELMTQPIPIPSYLNDDSDKYEYFISLSLYFLIFPESNEFIIHHYLF